MGEFEDFFVQEELNASLGRLSKASIRLVASKAKSIEEIFQGEGPAESGTLPSKDPVIKFKKMSLIEFFDNRIILR